MAVNPMQRKSRNSFLLGMILGLLITGVVAIILFLQLKKLKDEQTAEMQARVSVYTLNQDVAAGQVITEDMFTKKEVNKSTVPSNATSTFSVIDTWYLQTKDGKMIYTDAEGLYLNEPDNIIEIWNVNGEYYRTVKGEKEKVTLKTDPVVDDETQYGGGYVVDSTNDDMTRVYQDNNGNYYTYMLEDAITSSGSKRRVKKYLEINSVPVIAKIAMKANTVVTPNFVVQTDRVVTNDTRTVEYNMIVLPTDLMTEDYIDIRLFMPNGQNFIVVSKAPVEIPMNEDGTYIPDAIRINLREDEIILLSSAIVEAYGVQGARLEAVKYTEAGIQTAAIPTYVPNADASRLLENDPNIIATAREALRQRYTQAIVNIRNEYLQNLINSEQGYKDNVQQGMNQGAANSIESRVDYLESLGE